MAESFVVAEEKQTILLNRSADAAAELVTAERSRLAFGAGHRTEIENGSRVQRAVAEKLKRGSVELIGSGLRYRRHLCAGAFAVFRGVRFLRRGSLILGAEPKSRSNPFVFSVQFGCFGSIAQNAFAARFFRTPK